MLVKSQDMCNPRTITIVRRNEILMKRTLFLFAVVLLTGVAASAQQVFIASLSGAQEVPANASTARGTCRIILNAAETQVSVSCTYSGMGSNLTAGHTHGAAAVGVNAGVLFNYNAPAGSTSGTFNAGPFNVTAQNVADMRAHRHYANLHTTGFPGGEIRGQIKQAHTVYDNDGDGRSDPSVYRQSTTQFWSQNSLTGAARISTFGMAAGENHLNNTWDFDGDGLGDPLLIRLGPGNNLATWTILQSATNTLRSELWGDFSAAPGTVDTLAPADYDGDGRQDVAVYRRSTGTWWVIRSTDNARTATRWGASGAATGDFPSIGDYDGDGRADLTVVRVEGANRVWYTLRSSDGAERRTIFGASTDSFFFFAPFDVDGDGKQDIMVNRTVAGQRQFHWLQSSDGAYRVFSWGLSGTGSTALFGDYDGDGKTDFAARRVVGPNLLWEISRSSDGGTSYITWGLPTDTLVDGGNPDDFKWNQDLEMSNDQTSEDVTFRK